MLLAEWFFWYQCQTANAVNCAKDYESEIRTPKISALLLTKACARLLDTRCKRNLYVLRHRLLAVTHGTLLLRVSHHRFDPLYRPLTIVEVAGNILGQTFNNALVLATDVLVPEAREQVLLMQLVELCGLLRNIGEQVRDFFLDVSPARWQQIHLDDHIAVILEAARLGDQTPAFLGLRGRVEAIIGRGAESRFLSWVVRERLAVGDVAVWKRQAALVSRCCWKGLT